MRILAYGVIGTWSFLPVGQAQTEFRANVEGRLQQALGEKKNIYDRQDTHNIYLCPLFFIRNWCTHPILVPYFENRLVGKAVAMEPTQPELESLAHLEESYEASNGTTRGEKSIAVAEVSIDYTLELFDP